jgi:hypothetical protein
MPERWRYVPMSVAIRTGSGAAGVDPDKDLGKKNA